MSLPPSLIIQYLQSKVEDYRHLNDEFLMNSLFTNDYKRHMSVNTETGLWQCFKTHQSGNFYQLVSHIEGIPYNQAKKFIISKMLSSEEKEAYLNSMLHESKISPDIVARLSSLNTYYDDFTEIKDYAIGEPYLVSLGRVFLKERKIDYNYFKFYVALKGEFQGRLIIPYVENNELIYFQARALEYPTRIKYKNPSSQTGFKGSCLLYPFKRDKSHLYITEGPLDAITLCSQGFNTTCIGGSDLSWEQAKLIRDSKITKVVLAFDNDEPGYRGALKAKKLLRSVGVRDISFILPPKEYKDWNEAYVGEVEIASRLKNRISEVEYALFTGII